MREQEYRAAQRREERQHELTMMQMLLAATQNTAVNTIPTAFQCTQNTAVNTIPTAFQCSQNTAVNTIPTAFQCSNYPIVPGPNAENMHYIGTSTYTNRDDDNDYFEL